MDSVAGASPRQLARMAGALYLINIVGGAFAISIVPAMLLVAGDAAATAHNIQAHELLYRSGLAAHVVVTVTNVPLAMIFYELFKVVNRRLALLDVFFILVATAIESAGLVNQFAPLVLLGSGPYASALPATQLQALAYVPWNLSSIEYSLHTVFFGFDILCMAYLVLRSTFLPEPSCWRSTAWPTWSIASRSSWHPGLQPSWSPGSSCPRSLVKDRSACGSWWSAWTSSDGRSGRARRSGCSPCKWRRWDESCRLNPRQGSTAA
jgi:Domain of unknown function (DUF4386)